MALASWLIPTLLAADPSSAASQGPSEAPQAEAPAAAETSSGNGALRATKAARQDGGRARVQPGVPLLDPRFRLEPPQLRLDPTPAPRLLEDDGARGPDEPPVTWVLEQARLMFPAPTRLSEQPGQPTVTTEVGLRGSATIWGVRVWADSLARIDAKTSEEDSAPRVHLTGRRRVGVDARPSEHVHLGVVVSRRPGDGIDPLPSETRASATLRFGF